MESLKNETEYLKALKRLELVFDAVPNSKEGEELEALCDLIERYEDEYYPI